MDASEYGPAKDWGQRDQTSVQTLPLNGLILNELLNFPKPQLSYLCHEIIMP